MCLISNHACRMSLASGQYANLFKIGLLTAIVILDFRSGPGEVQRSDDTHVFHVRIDLETGSCDLMLSASGEQAHQELLAE